MWQASLNLCFMDVGRWPLDVMYFNFETVLKNEFGSVQRNLARFLDTESFRFAGILLIFEVDLYFESCSSMELSTI